MMVIRIKKEEIYKIKFNDLYFDTNHIVGVSSIFPSIENLKIAYSKVMELITVIAYAYDNNYNKQQESDIL